MTSEEEAVVAFAKEVAERFEDCARYRLETRDRLPEKWVLTRGEHELAAGVYDHAAWTVRTRAGLVSQLDDYDRGFRDGRMQVREDPAFEGKQKEYADGFLSGVYYGDR